MKQRIPLFENFIAGQPGATPQNTPGMGNVNIGNVAGGSASFYNGNVGSGDVIGKNTKRLKNTKVPRKRKNTVTEIDKSMETSTLGRLINNSHTLYNLFVHTIPQLNNALKRWQISISDFKDINFENKTIYFLRANDPMNKDYYDIERFLNNKPPIKRITNSNFYYDIFVIDNFAFLDVVFKGYRSNFYIICSS